MECRKGYRGMSLIPTAREAHRRISRCNCVLDQFLNLIRSHGYSPGGSASCIRWGCLSLKCSWNVLSRHFRWRLLRLCLIPSLEAATVINKMTRPFAIPTNQLLTTIFGNMTEAFAFITLSLLRIWGCQKSRVSRKRSEEGFWFLQNSTLGRETKFFAKDLLKAGIKISRIFSIHESRPNRFKFGA